MGRGGKVSTKGKTNRACLGQPRGVDLKSLHSRRDEKKRRENDRCVRSKASESTCSTDDNMTAEKKMLPPRNDAHMMFIMIHMRVH